MMKTRRFLLAFLISICTMAAGIVTIVFDASSNNVTTRAAVQSGQTLFRTNGTHNTELIEQLVELANNTTKVGVSDISIDSSGSLGYLSDAAHIRAANDNQLPTVNLFQSTGSGVVETFTSQTWQLVFISRDHLGYESDSPIMGEPVFTFYMKNPYRNSIFSSSSASSYDYVSSALHTNLKTDFLSVLGQFPNSVAGTIVTPDGLPSKWQSTLARTNRNTRIDNEQIWVPAYDDVFGISYTTGSMPDTNGMWNMSQYERAYQQGSEISDTAWLGGLVTGPAIVTVDKNGAGNSIYVSDDTFPQNQYAVRPAIHLKLSDLLSGSGGTEEPSSYNVTFSYRASTTAIPGSKESVTYNNVTTSTIIPYPTNNPPSDGFGADGYTFVGWWTSSGTGTWTPEMGALPYSELRTLLGLGSTVATFTRTLTAVFSYDGININATLDGEVGDYGGEPSITSPNTTDRGSGAGTISYNISGDSTSITFNAGYGSIITGLTINGVNVSSNILNYEDKSEPYLIASNTCEYKVYYSHYNGTRREIQVFLMNFSSTFLTTPLNIVATASVSVPMTAFIAGTMDTANGYTGYLAKSSVITGYEMLMGTGEAGIRSVVYDEDFIRRNAAGFIFSPDGQGYGGYKAAHTISKVTINGIDVTSNITEFTMAGYSTKSWTSLAGGIAEYRVFRTTGLAGVNNELVGVELRNVMGEINVVATSSGAPLPINYTNLLGGTSMPDLTYTVDTTSFNYALIAPTGTYTGYTFKQWLIGNESGAVATNSSLVAHISGGASTLTLWAEWELNTYEVYLPTGVGYTVEPWDGSVTPVDHGGEYSFKVTIDPTYSESNFTVSAAGGMLMQTGGAGNSLEFFYKVTGISADVYVTVSGVELNSYGLVLPPYGEEFGFDIEVLTPVPAYHGSNVMFRITVYGSHNKSMPTVIIYRTNNEAEVRVLQKVDLPITNIYYYVIENIDAEYWITVHDLVLNTYDITYPTEQVGYHIEDVIGSVSPVEHGKDFTFKVVLADGYTQSKDTIQVSSNGLTYLYPAIIDGNELYYTIPNVSSDQNIKIAKVELNKYKIGLPTGEGFYAFSEPGYTTTVEHGSEYEFRIETLQAYNKSTLIVKAITVDGKVKLDPVAVVANDDYYYYYSISVTKDTYITVDGIELNKYKVTWSDGEGFTITQEPGFDKNAVTHGYDFTFRITLADSHSNSTPMVTVTGGLGGMLEGVNSGNVWLYTITNITEDQTISVGAVIKNIYRMHLPSGVGFSASVEPDYSIMTTHGEKFAFRITMHAAYSKSEIEVAAVTANGTLILPFVVVPSGDYFYYYFEIDPVLAETHITISGVTYNTWNVTLENEDGFTLSTYPYADGNVFKVNEADDFQFRLEIWSSHNKSTGVIVFVNGVEVKPAEGLYTISKITEDKTVTVTGVVLNTYKLTWVDGEGYTFAPDPDGDFAGESSPIIIEHGTTFEFTVELDAAYSKSIPVVMATSTNSVQELSGTYIDGLWWFTCYVTADTQLSMKLDAVKVNSYAISWFNNQMYTIESEDGTVSPAIVKHGDAFAFDLTISARYSESIPVVTIVNADDSTDREELPGTLIDGVYYYLIPSVEKNIYIEVTADPEWKVNKYTITLVQDTDDPKRYEVESYNHTGDVDPIKVIHGNDFTFTVTVAAKYSHTEINVFATTIANLREFADAEILADGSKRYFYIIENVTANQTVTVTAQNPGFQVNMYTVQFVLDDVSPVRYAYTEIKDVLSSLGYQYTVSEDGTMWTITVEHGNSVQFAVDISEFYTQSGGSIIVRLGSTELALVGGVYTINNIMENKNVTVDGSELALNKYTVTLVNGGEGYVLSGDDTTADENKITYGEQYEFTLTIDDTHSKSAFEILVYNQRTKTTERLTINSPEVVLGAPNTYTCTITVTADMTVSVANVQKNTFSISLPNGGTVYTASPFWGEIGQPSWVVNNRNLVHNTTYNFTVTLSQYYSNNETLAVSTSTDTVNNAILAFIKKEGNVFYYSITVADTEVTTVSVAIADPAPNTYTIILEQDAELERRYEVTLEASPTNSTTVNYGDSLMLRVTLYDAKYDISKIVVGRYVTANNATLEANMSSIVARDGIDIQGRYYRIYQINNISLDQTVRVSNIELQIYKVTFQPGLYSVEGATLVVSGSTIRPVYHGGDYAFKITLNEGYTNSKITITAGGNPVEYDEDTKTYTIKNILKDTHVTVDNITGNMYTVTFTQSEKYATTGATLVRYGDSGYVFTVAKETDYLDYNMVVKVNGVEYTATGFDGNVYTFVINQIDGDQYIEIQMTKNENPGDGENDNKGLDPMWIGIIIAIIVIVLGLIVTILLWLHNRKKRGEV